MKVSEATPAQLEDSLLKHYRAMLATPADSTRIGVKRFGRILLIDVGHIEDLHVSSGMGYGEVYLTKQAIKSATMYYHDDLPKKRGKKKK